VHHPPTNTGKRYKLVMIKKWNCTSVGGTTTGCERGASRGERMIISAETVYKDKSALDTL
jgi:hypothetical protein